MKILSLLAMTCLITAVGTVAAWAGNGGPCGTGTVHPIPEPAALAVLGAGVSGLLAIRRRSRKKPSSDR